MMQRFLSFGVCLSLLALWSCTSASPAAYHTVQDEADPSAIQRTEMPAENPAAERSVEPAAPTVTTSADSSAQVATVQKVAPASDGQVTAALPVDPPPVTAPLPKPGGKIELLVPEKEFKKEGAEGALRVSFDDLDLLKILNMEPVPLDATKHFPEWLSSLDGKTIHLRGWMYPTLEQTGLPGFLFVRDNQICCFGRMAKVYDKVLVSLREGETTDYIQGRPFDVIGKFSIQPEEVDGELMLLYSISDGHVIDK
jgi:hypothetical protein